jgi:hypothetical protein
MRISRSIWWFIGCTVLMCLGLGGWRVSMNARDNDVLAVGQNIDLYSICIVVVAILGMIVSLILSFVPGVNKAERTAIPTAASVKRHRYIPLEFACIAHAALITATSYCFLRSSASIPAHIGIFIFLWWVVLGVWPFWIIVFWKHGWRTSRIMVTMLLGMLILSPVFFGLLIAWSLGHGSSLG